MAFKTKKIIPVFLLCSLNALKTSIHGVSNVKLRYRSLFS